MTSPHREAGEAARERPGIVYKLLPRAARPDMRLTIDAALPESAALDRRFRPPTVLDIGGDTLQENHQPEGPRLARRQTRKLECTGRRSACLREATGVSRHHLV